MVRKKFQTIAQTPADQVVAALQPHGGRYTLADMLFAACEAKMPILVSGFLAHGADPSLLTTRFLQMQPLHMSCMKGDILSAAHLIGAGAPLDNAMNTLEETPLHMACSFHQKSDDVAAQLAYLLLSAGAGQGARNKFFNQTERQVARASEKKITEELLVAFTDGDMDGPIVSRVRALVATSLATINNDPAAFMSAIRNPEIKETIAAKLAHSWCDKPVNHKPLPHP